MKKPANPTTSAITATPLPKGKLKAGCFTIPGLHSQEPAEGPDTDDAPA